MTIFQKYRESPFKIGYTVYPGLLVATTLGIAATWLSQHYHAPVMLFALLLGLSANFLYREYRCIPGINFAATGILRIGVALLGARITISQIADLGLRPILIVIAGVVTTIAFGAFVARIISLRIRFGILTGGSVAICGASAALAISSVFPATPERERDTLFAVVTVTALSTLAMIFYPAIVPLFHLNSVTAGVFLGGTIHDVAQVVGAGYAISPQTGDVATYVKLLRVAMLIPVVFTLAVAFRLVSIESKSDIMPRPPLFLIGFCILAILNSAGLLTMAFANAATMLSGWCLVTAIAAIGTKTTFGGLIDIGWRPVILMVTETIWIGLLVLLTVMITT